VATSRLFRLRAEVAPTPSGPKASSLAYVKVRVDTGVFHLEELYDYCVPEKFSNLAAVGIRIQIPFGNKEVEGIIVERVAQPERSGTIKFITKILSPYPVATVASLKLFDEIARDYACNPWDVIRSAIPPRVASVDKKLATTELSLESRVQPTKSANPRDSKKVNSRFIQLVPTIDASEQVASIAGNLLAKGNVLIVAPDENDVDQIIKCLVAAKNPVLKLTASMSREERYANFLECLSDGTKIVVGSRSSVFAPVSELSSIIIFKESSPEHYEIRSPGWNSKDVAKKRSKLEKVNLITVGFCPSLQMAHAIDEGESDFEPHQSSVLVHAFNPDLGTLLPGRIFPEIRKALKNGPVLFLAARKGYGNALLCAQCRNVAQCDCGGRLQVGGRLSSPICVHCGKSHKEWKCAFCKGSSQYLAGRGIERASEEISRAFPGIPVIISAGDVIKDRVEAKPSLVLSTPGAQPRVKGGYAGVVILDAIRLFSHTDIRTPERARETIFETAALVGADGSVIMVIDTVHPIIPAITRWNVVPLLKRDLAERKELNLPPYVASAVLVLSEEESISIATGLRQAINDSRLPPSVQVFGPTPITKSQSKIVLYCDHSEAGVFQSFLHELQKKRSVARKDLLTLRLEPYSL
jgi:primosomal protein N' (replication factor Y) (superfamily II helicase)